MSDDLVSKYVLDLDSESFKSGIEEAIGKMKGIAEVAGIVGAAFLAAKVAMGAVFKMEDIEAVEKQFGILAEQAGVYGETLKTALIEAGHGWADHTDLMRAANKAMLNFEISANNIPKLMEMARKVSLVMGGDMIDNFNAIAKSVEFGNTRMLRQIGIKIDMKKAYADFAAEHRKEVANLTEAGKQQAILNALLKYEKEHLDNASKGVREVSGNYKQLKAALADAGEETARVIGKIMTPMVKDAIKYVTGLASAWKNVVVALGGSGTEQTAAKIELLKNKINSTASAINSLRAQLVFSSGPNTATIEQLNAMTKAQENYRKELVALEAQQKKTDKDKEEKPGGDKASKEIQGFKTVSHASVMTRKEMSDYQLKKDQEDLYNTDNMYKQMTRSAQINANQATDAWRRSGQLGGAAMTSFQSQSVKAFKAIGDGSKSPAEAVKAAFLGMLGDIATQQGEFMMLDAFKTFPAINAPEFAAGGALIALGSALGGMASGTSASAGSISGGGGGGGSNDLGAQSTLPGSQTTSTGPRSVNLIIQGHMLTDENTARWIVDKVRQAADAQDFKVSSVGGGF